MVQNELKSDDSSSAATVICTAIASVVDSKAPTQDFFMAAFVDNLSKEIDFWSQLSNKQQKDETMATEIPITRNIQNVPVAYDLSDGLFYCGRSASTDFSNKAVCGPADRRQCVFCCKLQGGARGLEILKFRLPLFSGGVIRPVDGRDLTLLVSYLSVFLDMKVDQPENSTLRESLSSNTKMVMCLIKVVNYITAPHYCTASSTIFANPLPSQAAQLLDLLLKLDENSEAGLLSKQDIPTIVSGMCSTHTADKADFQAWGCSALKYIVLREGKGGTSSSLDQMLLQEDVVGVAAIALANHKDHEGLNQEAIDFLEKLIEAYPSLKTEFLGKGILQNLSAVLQSKSLSSKVQETAKALIMTTLS